MDHAQTTLWRNKIIYLFVSGFVIGIAVSSFVFISPLVSLLLIVISGGIVAGEKILNGKVDHKVVVILLLLGTFALGALRFAIKDFHLPQEPLSTGVVISEPNERGSVKRFVFRSDNGEKVLVSVPLYTPLQYGDKVEVRGSFKVPGIISDEDGSFDYGEYLAKDDIYHTLSFSEVKVIESGHGSRAKEVLFKVKSNFIKRLQESLPEPEASLLSGLIVSGREALPENILDEFKRVGLIHIVVLSGYNITLIAEFIRRFFQKFFTLTKLPVIPQAISVISIVGIILFIIMVGAGAAVVRAAIMAIVAIGAKLFGRNYSAFRALILAAFLMVAENPKILIFDPSFQLSFLATLGLIAYAKPIEAKFSWVTQRWGVRATLSQTLATQLTVLPFLIYLSGDVSLIALPANLLVLPFIPYAMLTGFMAGMIDYLSRLIAWPIYFLSHVLLSWVLFVAGSLGNLSFATLEMHLSLGLVILIYTILWVEQRIDIFGLLEQVKLISKLSRNFRYIQRGDSGI